MACTFEVWIADGTAAEAGDAANAAFVEAERIEQELSRFVVHSDVSRFNRVAPGEPLRIGIEAFECLDLALRINRETHGAFDATVTGRPDPAARSREAWHRGGRAGAASVDGDGSTTGNDPAPTKSPGLRDPAVFGPPAYRLDSPAHTITKLRPGVTADLGGIGKGYALDRMAGLLAAWGVSRGLVHAGGSTVRLIGSADAPAPWSLALRHPADPEATLGRVRLKSGALSGSGRRIHGGHIIDPRTGRAAESALAAWAGAPSAARADALSTAMMVMSPEAVEAHCRDHPEVTAALALPPWDRPKLVSLGIAVG